MADNVIREGKMLAAQDDAARAVQQTLKLMGEHPRLDAAVIQTVGGKHWDGFAFATVT